MYPSAYGYGRQNYSIPSRYDSRGPPPLSHQPYGYNNSPRYNFNTYPPCSSPSYNHVPPLAQFNDPRGMEIHQREAEIPPLHHLPPAQMYELRDPVRADYEGPAPHFTDCEQGNQRTH